MNEISSNAKIGLGNIFGKYVVIGDDVTLGDNNEFGDFVSIKGKVVLGSNNYVASHVSMGGTSNHVVRKNMLEKGKRFSDTTENLGSIIIGCENSFGEFVTVHLPVLSQTVVGNGCNIGYHTHISHDVYIEDNVLTGLQSAIGGYVHILQGANLGINSMVHPRLVVGQYSAIGLGTVIIRHVLPAATVVGNPAHFLKTNKIGLSRNKFSEEEIASFCDFLETATDNIQSIQNRRIRSIYEHFYELVAYWRSVGTVPVKGLNHD